MKAVRSRPEAEKCIQDLARLSVRLALAAAARDAAVERAQQLFAARIEALASQLTDGKANVQQWAEQNRAAFGGAQSLEFPSGTIAFRQGPRALDLLAGMDWKGVLKRMTGKFWAGYIRRKPEVDRAKLLAESKPDGEAAPVLSAGKLRAIGLRVSQAEGFRIELRTGPNQVSVL